MFLLIGALAGGCGSSGSAPPPQPVAYHCNGTTGLEEPLQVCSQTQPCSNAIVFVNGQLVTDQTVTTASDAPVCATQNHLLDDGPPEQWTDVDGVIHYACLFKPGGTSPASPRPLLIYFHGAGGNASHVYDVTGIRVKAIDYNLSGDPARLGFILASVQGRNLHFPPGERPGRHHDYYYRDLASPSTNPDVENVDQLIDTLVAQGGVDPQQIYVMGWSNGALFAQMYAIARFDTATPGGNHVAAGAGYAFGNPFDNFSNAQTPSCELNPYPVSMVPLYLINRTCDALTGCNAEQEQKFHLPPGRSAEDWVTQLMNPSYVNDLNVTFQRIHLSTDLLAPGAAATECDAASSCTQDAGTNAHLEWPYGPLYGAQDPDWEIPMLDYLAANPHP
jgi:poly(3-hydroxybutyrate) depolymerase